MRIGRPGGSGLVRGRARDQELGDVLAEGVYWLLDEGRPRDWLTAADADHWARFLGRRRRLIEDVLRRVRSLPAGSGLDRRAMEDSLRAALGRLRIIEPAFCVAYLRAWDEDRRTWAAHLRKIPKLGCEVAEAMKLLVKDPINPLRGTFHR
jgi:hypothetical protein